MARGGSCLMKGNWSELGRAAKRWLPVGEERKLVSVGVGVASRVSDITPSSPSSLG